MAGTPIWPLARKGIWESPKGFVTDPDEVQGWRGRAGDVPRGEKAPFPWPSGKRRLPLGGQGEGPDLPRRSGPHGGPQGPGGAPAGRSPELKERGGEAVKMSQRTQEVVPLTRELVREYLEEEDFRYLVDRDGDFLVILKTPYPQKLFALFAVTGRKGEILQILIHVDPSPPMEEAEALRLVNAWNSEKRWPRAFYKDGVFYLDWNEDWETGVTPAILAHTCDRVLQGAHLFLEELNGEGRGLMEALLEALRRDLEGDSPKRTQGEGD